MTVLHATCMEADAGATALGALPPGEAQKLATREKLQVRLFTRDGGEWLSSAFQALIEM